MLGWLTLIAATIGALGSIVGPIVAYRSAVRAIQQRAEDSEAERRQLQVDRAVDLAVGENPRGAGVGISMLDYFADSGELSPSQASAVYSALDSAVTLDTDSTDGGWDGWPDRHDGDDLGDALRLDAREDNEAQVEEREEG